MRIKHIKNRLALGWRLVRRDLRSRHAGGAAGIARRALLPLPCILLVVAAFALLAPGGAGRDLPVALLVIVPIALWSFFADVVVRSTILLREQGYPAKRTASFPLWVAPLVPLVAASLNQLVLFAIVAVLTIGTGLGPVSSLGLFLVAWLVSSALTAGLACAAAAVLKAWNDVAPAAPVDDVDNLVRSVPIALRKLKREAAELRRQNLELAGQVDARLQRLERQVATAPASFIHPAPIAADTHNANHRNQK